jgi:predicted nicotinamide N-methyase
MSEHASFVVAETALAAPPLVPEIRLYLASEITPLWQATEARLAETGTPPPYWAFAWPGGQAIARQLLDEPALVAGRRVLDFAAGSGLAAIAAAKAGASAVEAAEIDPLAGAAIALNAAANGVDIAWRDADLVGSDARWDVVLAGDICYERPMAERVMPWLRRLAAHGCLVLMGDPGRSYLPGHGLARMASHVVPTSRELEDRTERETVIWRVLP